MPATTNPSAAHPRAAGAGARRVPLRRNEEFFYREAGPGPRPPSGATGTRRAPLRRHLAFYDLSQPSPINAYTPDPAGAAHRVPLTRQVAFYDVNTTGPRSGASVDGAAAIAQTSSAAGVQQPSANAGLGDMVAALLAESAKRKRTFDDVATGDAKRRRVGSDAQPLSRAQGRKTAGKTASTHSTGATASTHHFLTATAASSAARDVHTTQTKSAGTGQVSRQISKMPKRGALAGPSTPPRRVSAAVSSGPPPAPELSRVRDKRTGSGTTVDAQDENEDASAAA